MWTIVAATSSLRWNSTESCVARMAAGTLGVVANQLQYPYDLTLDSNNSLYIKLTLETIESKRMWPARLPG